VGASSFTLRGLPGIIEDVNRATFFSQAVAGTLVKARGSLNGSTVTWSEMELED